eukprot:761665-Hanusia_phi.AAC.7
MEKRDTSTDTDTEGQRQRHRLRDRDRDRDSKREHPVEGQGKALSKGRGGESWRKSEIRWDSGDTCDVCDESSWLNAAAAI